MRMIWSSCVLLICTMTAPCLAQADKAQLNKVRDKAIAFLKTSQTREGAYSPRIGIGVTALAATALMSNGVSTADPAVAKALKLVVDSARDDGGIYAENSRLKIYETCVAIQCLQAANKDGKYDAILKKATGFIRGEQFDEGENKTPEDLDYGGAGYGGKSRPDLSNTAFLIEALDSVKSDENDEAIKRAMLFVSRCQNLESPFNTSPEAAKINDGGFFYTVSSGGNSPAGETPDGGLRSYGSMTYAGFKSMIYAGLNPDDPRVKAAKTWIEKNYTLQNNPGMGDAGLYYYYSLFAKALAVSKLDKIKDPQGKEHDWRAELVSHLASLQAENGSFTNKNTKWMEGDPNLATTFCLLALSHCD